MCKIQGMARLEARDVWAVILAAGGSSRLGRPKQFLLWKGEPLLRRVARMAAGSSCRSVLIVAGEHQQTTQDAVRGIPSEVLFNPDWEKGLSTSIKRAVHSLMGRTPEPRGALFLTCDQPLVNGTIIDQLVELFCRGEGAIVAAEYGGSRGIPAVFGRSVFPELTDLTGDRGAKSVIERDPRRVVSLSCPQASVDIDTPADWERTQRSLQQGEFG